MSIDAVGYFGTDRFGIPAAHYNINIAAAMATRRTREQLLAVQYTDGAAIDGEPLAYRMLACERIPCQVSTHPDNTQELFQGM